MATSILKSRFPLIQAPMAGVQNENLAIAACRAGALGSIPAAMLDVDELNRQIEAIVAAVDGAPYNVNFFVHEMPVISDARRQRQRELLRPWFDELGVDPESVDEGVLRRPFDVDQLSVVEKHRPPVVSFHFGLPEKKLLDAVKKTGALVLSTATTLAEGLWLEENGADVVVAQGVEAGGHRGMFLSEDPATQIGTFALIQLMSRCLKIPVVAAGGIADEPGIRAVMRLGAVGVQIGTTYMLCDECRLAPAHKKALERVAEHPEECETALTNLYSGRCARGMVTKLMKEAGYINENVLPFPYASSDMVALRKAAEEKGIEGFAPMWCGENPTGCLPVSAEELTRRLCVAFA